MSITILNKLCWRYITYWSCWRKSVNRNQFLKLGSFSTCRGSSHRDTSPLGQSVDRGPWYQSLWKTVFTTQEGGSLGQIWWFPFDDNLLNC